MSWVKRMRRAGMVGLVVLALAMAWGTGDGVSAQGATSTEASQDLPPGGAEGSPIPGRRLGMRIDNLYFSDEGHLIAEITLANVGTQTINRLEASMIVLNECEIPPEGEEPDIQRQLQTCRYVTYNE